MKPVKDKTRRIVGKGESDVKKPTNLTPYESVQWDLARYRGLQYALKARRKRLEKTIALCHKRYAENGVRYLERDLVPRQAAKDLFRATVKLGEVQKAIRENRLRISRLEEERLTIKRKDRRMTYFANITLYDLERRYILLAMEHFKNDKLAAAKALGISRHTLHNKLSEYGEKT